jgi:hypothetical protein
MHCRVEPGKSATGDDYSSRLHAVTANRNATREIEILLMAAIIQSFFHLFLKPFSVQILQNLGFSGGFFMRRLSSGQVNATNKLDNSLAPWRWMARTSR